jgi:hypothetical protein
LYTSSSPAPVQNNIKTKTQIRNTKLKSQSKNKNQIPNHTGSFKISIKLTSRHERSRDELIERVPHHSGAKQLVRLSAGSLKKERKKKKTKERTKTIL